MKNRATFLALALLSRTALADEPTPAPPPDGRHEIYLASGLSVYMSDRRVIAGLGGGPGYRFYVSDRIALHVEGRYVLYLGNTYLASAGATYGFAFGPWEPTVGLEGLLVTGDRISVLSSAHPGPPPSVAWAVQLKLTPLRFQHAPFVVSALGASIGLGDDGGSRALSFSLSFLEMGVRL